MKVWVSALIPMRGADTYDGVRLQVSLSEKECYRDLAEWLELEDLQIGEGIPIDFSKAVVEQALDDEVENSELILWNVEVQELYGSRGEKLKVVRIPKGDR